MPVCPRAIVHLTGGHTVQFHHSFGVSAASSSSSDRISLKPRRQNRMFILGVGYVGKFFGRQLINDGWVVSGTCKNANKVKELDNEGFDISLFDANKPEMSVLSSMNDYSHLLVSIPPVAQIGDLMLQQENILRGTLKGESLRWLCYLSSTSVYGDCSGELVDEDYPANPSRGTAKLRLDAERGWLDLGKYLGVSTLVFRLGGIYGPGRSAVDTIISKKSMTDSQKMRSSKQYTSRVHVEDICQALMASMSTPQSSRIYNIVDDDPAPREEVFGFAWDMVMKKWPLLQANSSLEITRPHAIGTGSSDEKRVSNARMKRELGVRLVHPSYKSGLQSIVEQIDYIHAVHN
ncbi:hypothetical protein SAY87_014808 [Trapa incisa]|uniref:NAD-dependent epimerase/dehydratase domain-containing protein n=1 Tax=Trapa incisa TaxID=236973 RepID=A0AAN7JKY9_9MYRT|nr:hypothetical protein SAY87_014808 [Trapa incisa]